MRCVLLCLLFVLICHSTWALTALEPEQTTRNQASEHGWAQQGRTDAKSRISLLIALKQQNKEILEKKFWSCSDPESFDYGNYWKLEELSEVIRADSDDLQKVKNWLHQYDIFDYEIAATGDFIALETDARTAEQMLHTEFFDYERNEHRVARASAYYVPDDVVASIDLIAGTLRLPGTGHVASIEEEDEKGADYTPQSDATTPQVIRARYNVNAVGRHPKTLQAVASFLKQYISPADLRQFQKDLRLPVQSVERFVGPNDPSRPGDEAALDIQYLMGVAPGVRTWAWSTAGLHRGHEGQEPFLKWLYLISNTSVVPDLFSISYGDIEDELGRTYMSRVSTEFQKAAVRGITFLTASGDDGTRCVESCDRFRPEFPTSSPYITSVGATKYVWSSSRIVDEVATSWTGGGFSDVFAMPAYQRHACDVYLNQTSTPAHYFNRYGRGYPDVATVGSRFDIVHYGKHRLIGGTSASTPTFGAIVSLLNDLRFLKGQRSMGFINPFLYWAAQQDARAFTPVTKGHNQRSALHEEMYCRHGQQFVDERWVRSHNLF